MPDHDEEQRLRERLLKRKQERRTSDAASSQQQQVDDGDPKTRDHPSSVSAATATTTASTSPSHQLDKPDNKESPQKKKQKIEEGSPKNKPEDHSAADVSKNSQSASTPAAYSSSNPNSDQRESNKSHKRERHREHKRINSRDGRGGDGGYGDREPDRYTGRHPPPPGRWERDYGGGGPRYDRGRGGGRGPRGRYYDDRRGPPPPHYRGDRRDRSPPGGRRHRRGRSPSPASHGSSRKLNQEDWSYGDSYSSKSPSRSNSLNSPDGSRGGKVVDNTPRSRDSHNSASRGSRDRRSYDRRSGSGSGGHRFRRDDYSSSSYSSSSSSSLSSSSDSENGTTERKGSGSKRKQNVAGSESVFTKDQRTVFVSQLVMRTTEKDIRRYFKKKVGCKVNEVILLRDRRTRNHKGCAYVEFARVEDVATAVGVSGQPPDFQRFPILVKASEAEKNYAIPASSSVVTASMMGTTINYTPFVDKDGKQVEAQKVYVGGLDPTVTEEHLFAIFSQFGQLDKVSMQMDPATNLSRGYAFLSFRDPKDANLSIQSMAGQVLAGRPMKTGWANQASSIPGVPIVTSDEYPEDGSARVQKAFQVLGQLIGGSSEAAINAMALSATAEKAIEAAMGMAEPPKLQNVGADESALQVAAHSASSIPTVAEARASMQASIEAQKSAVAVAAATAALTPATTPKLIGGADNPTRHILVYNMFDKDEETEPGWEKDIEEEFLEEAAKFGKIEKVVVMHKEPGGKIYASFEGIDGAEACAKNLAGRWFDKRQLRVDFIDEKDLFKESAPSLS